MTKRIDKDRAKELRRQWKRLAKMWLSEATKMQQLADTGPKKYYFNRKQAVRDATAEAAKYVRWIKELDEILNDND